MVLQAAPLAEHWQLTELEYPSLLGGAFCSRLHLPCAIFLGRLFFTCSDLVVTSVFSHDSQEQDRFCLYVAAFDMLYFICVGKMVPLYTQDIVCLVSGFTVVGKWLHPMGYPAVMLSFVYHCFAIFWNERWAVASLNSDVFIFSYWEAQKEKAYVRSASLFGSIHCTGESFAVTTVAPIRGKYASIHCVLY